MNKLASKRSKTIIGRATNFLRRRILATLFRFWYKRRHQTVCLEKIGDLSLLITPEVFNPNLFGSSVFMLNYLQSHFAHFQGEALDIGCGSGLLGVWLAQQGAQVTATDINPQAVWVAGVNARLNQKQAENYHALVGSLYTPLVTDAKFDLIVMNPPYYAHTPNTALEHAFMAGPELEILTGMITGAANHLKPAGKVLAVLSSTIPLEKTLEAAQQAGLSWQIVAQKRYWAEWHLIYGFQLASGHESRA